MKQTAETIPNPSSTGSRKTIRALRFNGEVAKLESNYLLSEPEPGEAIIRTAKTAVSATDLQICSGLFSFTGTLGHEFVGYVESINGDSQRELIGKRVVGSIDAVCGKCDMCMAGLKTHCRDRTVLGRLGRDGCLADAFILPTTNLLAVPDAIDNDHAVFIHALAAAIQAARQLTIEGRPYITVLGDGPLGLLTVQVMAKLNASVRLIGRYSEKLAICEKWGVKHRHIDDIGRRADQDIVVECTGAPAGLELAMQLVRPRGTIVLKTLLADQSNVITGLDLSPIVINEITLLGSRSGPMSQALAMIEKNEIDVVSLIGKRMSLADGPAVLKAASQSGMLKVLVDP